MQSDFSVFRERLAEACRARNMTNEGLCRSLGLGGRRAIDFHIFRAQINRRLPPCPDRR
jgi:hypothetical protein